MWSLGNASSGCRVKEGNSCNCEQKVLKMFLKMQLLLVLLKGDVDGLAVAPWSAATAASRPASTLSLRFGGDDVQRVFLRDFLLRSEVAGGVDLDKSSWWRGKSESSGGWSSVAARGSGLMMLHMCPKLPSLCLDDSSSMASVLRMTRKCVVSEGVMVRVLGSLLSFLLICMRTRGQR